MTTHDPSGASQRDLEGLAALTRSDEGRQSNSRIIASARPGSRTAILGPVLAGKAARDPRGSLAGFEPRSGHRCGIGCPALAGRAGECSCPGTGADRFTVARTAAACSRTLQVAAPTSRRADTAQHMGPGSAARANATANLLEGGPGALGEAWTGATRTSYRAGSKQRVARPGHDDNRPGASRCCNERA